MTPFQRRTLWICVFGMAFILWYEASGVALVHPSNFPPLTGEGARRHFWEQFGYGAIFLVLGAVVTIVVRKRTEPAPYITLDWIALGLGIAILAATAFRSYSMVSVNGVP